MKYFRKILKVLGKGAIALLVLFLLMYVLIQFPNVQTWIVQKVATNLSKTLDAKVEIGSVNIKFFKTVSLQDIYIEDQQKDTLIFAQELDASIGLFSIFDSKIHLNQITLNQATVNLNRSSDDSQFNFNFLIDAFSTNEPNVKKDTTASKAWEFEIGNVLLQKVNLNMKDDYAGLDLKTKVGELTLNLNVMDLKNQQLEFQNIDLKNSLVKVTMAKSSDSQIANNQEVTNESNALIFPYVGWDFKAQNFSINETDVFIKNKN